MQQDFLILTAVGDNMHSPNYASRSTTIPNATSRAPSPTGLVQCLFLQEMDIFPIFLIADLFDFGAEALTALNPTVCHSDGAISIHAHSGIDRRRGTVKPAHHSASSQPSVLLPCWD